MTIFVTVSQKNLDASRKLLEVASLRQVGRSCPVALAFSELGYTDVRVYETVVRTSDGSFRNSQEAVKFINEWDECRPEELRKILPATLTFHFEGEEQSMEDRHTGTPIGMARAFRNLEQRISALGDDMEGERL